MFAKLRATFSAVLLVSVSSLALGAGAPAQARTHSAAHGHHGFSHGFEAHSFGGLHSFASDHVGPHSEPGLGAGRFAASDHGGSGVAHFSAPDSAAVSDAAHFVASASAERGGFQPGVNGWRDFRDHHNNDSDHHTGRTGRVFLPFAYEYALFALLASYGVNGLGYADFLGYGYNDLVSGALVPFGYASGVGANTVAPGATITEQPASAGATGMAVEPTSAGATGAAAGELCGIAQPIADAVPVARLKDTLKPDAEQSSKLQALIESEAAAAGALQASCATLTQGLPTPVERLEMVEARLKNMVQAVDAIRGPLDAFYASLSEEQKARFNDLGPASSPRLREAEGAANLAAKCAPEDEIPIVAVAEIARAVAPNDVQRANLAALYEAAGEAYESILASCPAVEPSTPPGRLAAIRARLVVMLNGVDEVRPALERFWTSLDVDQRSRLISIMRPAAPNGPTASAE